jgi:hypothetical protein
MKETTTRKATSVKPAKAEHVRTKFPEFEQFMKKLVSVPKSEIDKRMPSKKRIAKTKLNKA